MQPQLPACAWAAGTGRTSALTRLGAFWGPLRAPGPAENAQTAKADRRDGRWGTEAGRMWNHGAETNEVNTAIVMGWGGQWEKVSGQLKTTEVFLQRAAEVGSQAAAVHLTHAHAQRPLLGPTQI